MAKRTRERRAALHKARLEGLRKIHDDLCTILCTEMDYAKKTFEDCIPIRVHVDNNHKRTIESSPLESQKELDP